MCYCGKTFDNQLEVDAHNSEAHKEEYTCGYEVTLDPFVKSHMMKREKCGAICTQYILNCLTKCASILTALGLAVMKKLKGCNILLKNMVKNTQKSHARDAKPHSPR